MKTLVIMRHGTASSPFGYEDKKRPLSLEGIDEVKSVSKQLVDEGLTISKAVVSDAKRTTETFVTLQKSNSHWHIEAAFHSNLYHGGFDELLSAAAELPDKLDTVLWVGHNPGVSEVASFLSKKMFSFRPSEALVLQCKAENWVDALCSLSWKAKVKLSPIS